MDSVCLNCCSQRVKERVWRQETIPFEPLVTGIPLYQYPHPNAAKPHLGEWPCRIPFSAAGILVILKGKYQAQHFQTVDSGSEIQISLDCLLALGARISYISPFFLVKIAVLRAVHKPCVVCQEMGYHHNGTDVFLNIYQI